VEVSDKNKAVDSALIEYNNLLSAMLESQKDYY
jgi:hypothetical protein